MGNLLGLIFGSGIALIVFSLTSAERKSPPNRITEKYWPTFCDDISAGVRAGLAIPEATFQASTSLPIFLQQEFVKAKKDFAGGESFSGCIQKLATQIEDQTFSRITRLILTAQTQNSAAISGLLSEQAHNLRSDLALLNEILGKQAVTKVSAKVASLAPLVVLVLTSTRPTVRDAYLQPIGIAVLLVVGFVTVFSYLVMRNISEIKVLKNA